MPRPAFFPDVQTARRWKIALGMVAAWVAAAAITGALVAPPEEPARPVVTLAFGVVVGALSAAFELVMLPRYVRRLTSGRVLLVRTGYYVVVIALVVVVLAGLVGAVQLGVRPREVFASSDFVAFLGSRQFLAIVALLTLASFLINFARQVRLMLGPGTLWSLLLGRYARPVAEERVFLFLDLTASTALAERLGPARFNDFKNDFFHDVSEPVLATRGQIYQYVGDEVVVTWRVRNGRASGNALRTFFLIEDAVEVQRARYERRYGEAPAFKAGLHAGPVVTAEIGDLKKDIVHSGDAVNVAARIEAECRPRGRRLIISERVLELTEVPLDAEIEDLGLVALRGRDGPVRIYGVHRLATREPTRRLS
ncbi:MAG: adenylate/guanylate cyclase domain-containing protein [Rhodothermales bacterium]